MYIWICWSTNCLPTMLPNAIFLTPPFSFIRSLALSLSVFYPAALFLKVKSFFYFCPISLSLSLSLSYLVWAFKIKILVLWSVCTQQCLTVTVFSALSLCSILFLPVFISACTSLHLTLSLPVSAFLDLSLTCFFFRLVELYKKSFFLLKRRSSLNLN